MNTLYPSWNLLLGWLIALPFILSMEGLITGLHPMRSVELTGPAGLPKIESKVYLWEPINYRYLVQGQRLAQGSTTHLESLSVEAITLWDNIMSVSDADDFLNVSDTNQNPERLIIVKEGTVSIQIDTLSKNVGPGSVALILPGDHYTVKNLEDTPAVYYLLTYQSKSPVDPTRGQQAGGSFIVDWKEVEYRKHDKGGRRDFFDRPTAMCENFEMHVTNLNLKTSSHAPHTHQVEEIILMVQGNISMHIDGHETEALDGDFAFIDSMVPHRPTNIGSEQAIYFAFQWK